MGWCGPPVAHLHSSLWLPSSSRKIGFSIYFPGFSDLREFCLQTAPFPSESWLQRSMLQKLSTMEKQMKWHKYHLLMWNISMDNSKLWYRIVMQNGCIRQRRPPDLERDLDALAEYLERPHPEFFGAQLNDQQGGELLWLIIANLRGKMEAPTSEKIQFNVQENNWLDGLARAMQEALACLCGQKHQPDPGNSLCSL